MNEVFNKKEEAKLDKAMKRRVFASLLVTSIIIIESLIKVHLYGGFSKIHSDYPFLITVNYVMLTCIVYAVTMFILGFFREKNQIINRIYFILNLPPVLFTHFIFIPFKRYVRPYLLPFFVYFMTLLVVFFLMFFLFIFFDENAGKRLPLIMYLIITIYTTLISYAVNFIFKHFIQRDELIDFKEGKNEKEKMQNYHLYELGFNNNKKAYEIAMRYFHQDNVKVLIYSFYFITILISSIITLGGFVDETSYVKDIIQVLLLSFATYIGFERIMKNKNLFNLNGKTVENTAVA